MMKAYAVRYHKKIRLNDKYTKTITANTKIQIREIFHDEYPEISWKIDNINTIR